MAHIPSRRSWDMVEKLPNYTRRLPRIARFMCDVAAHGDQAEPSDCMSTFSCSQIPDMSLDDFFIRLFKYTQAEEQVFVLTLIFIQRAIRSASWRISSYNIHRLVSASFVVAAKLGSDIYYANSYYAEVTGQRPRELNRHERDFLSLIGWNCYVTGERYADTLTSLDAMEIRQPREVRQIPAIPTSAPPSAQTSALVPRPPPPREKANESSPRPQKSERETCTVQQGVEEA
eukprot:Hpha_TRINITY_DN15912_c4_g3::TRINITY_DN15912_c4_g3_i1::g.70889::m.70889